MDTLVDLVNPRAVLGGNHPPEPISPSIERAQELVATTDKWITERPEITDEDIANRARDFVEQLRKASTALDDEHEIEKAPHLKAGKAVDDKFRTPRASIKLALDAMKLKLGTWMEKQRAKAAAAAVLAAQEAERKRKEAEELAEAARLAAETKGASPIAAQLRAEEALEVAEQAEQVAAQGPAPTRVAGNFSSRSMGLRTTWHARLKVVTDPKEQDALTSALLKHYAKNRAARDAMAAACLAIADKQAKLDKRTDTAPPGIEFFSKSTAS